MIARELKLHNAAAITMYAILNGLAGSHPSVGNTTVSRLRGATNE
jgi:hypothetical protein